MQIYLTTVSNDVQIDDLGEVEFNHPSIGIPLLLPEGQFTLEEILGSLDLQELLLEGQLILYDGTNHPIEDLTVTSSIQWPSLQVGVNTSGFSIEGSAITNKMVVPMECYAETNNTTDNGINYNNLTPIYVRFSGTKFSNNSYFVWNATTHRWTIANTADPGYLGASVLINLYCRGARGHVTGRVVRVRGKEVISKRLGSTYFRNGNGHDRDTVSGEQYFDYQAGDQFYVEIFRDGTTSTAAYINDYSNFSLRRIG